MRRRLAQVLDIRLLGIERDRLLCRVPDLANEVTWDVACKIVDAWAGVNHQRVVRVRRGRNGDVLFTCTPSRAQINGSQAGP